MTGRLHVLHGDLTLLRCDVAVVPTDALLRVEPSWAGLVEQDEARAGAPSGWPGGTGGRTFALPPRENGGPARVLLELAAEGARPVEWYVNGVRDAMTRALDVHERRGERPLIALPLVGTGLGGWAGRRGDLIPPLLEMLVEIASGEDVDVALVAYDGSDYAAVQAARGDRTALPGALEEHARRLAALVVRNDLVLFLGAGVSAAAGLPAWWDLLERVADRADLLGDGGAGDGSRQEPLRERLHDLGTLDAAELMRTLLGQDAIRAVIGELDADHHSLAHGLLASLGASRAVTTNYDRLYELASRRPLAERGGLAVLPWDAADPDRAWLVKMHGDVGRPDSIVLSRGDLAGYDVTRKPLGSLLQAQMLTGHLLFVGSSMTDDAVLRLAWEVRELFQAWGAPTRVVGTVLTMRDEPLRARLWEDILSFVSLAPLTGGGEADAAGSRGRHSALPAFLDRLAQLAARERSYLLDPRYENLVSHELRPLRDGLLRLGDVVRDLPEEIDEAVVADVAASLRAFGWTGRPSGEGVR